MKRLEDEIIKLKNSLEKIVKEKLNEFSKNINLSPEEKFIHLCFCILVANTSLNKTFEIWKAIDKKFLTLTEEELKEELEKLGYRFPNRASYIAYSRKYIKEIDNAVLKADREWLVENIKGIGWKEASHFLRNMGYRDFAILDRHVLRTLEEYKIIDKIPKSLSKKFYLETEGKLREIAKKLNMSIAELDFYLFYLRTKELPKL